MILIGLFARPIPEGRPLYGTLLPGLGDFCLTGVNPGTYYLMATSVSWGMEALDVLLHLPRPDDPPILISLPLLMNSFLKRVSQNGNR